MLTIQEFIKYSSIRTIEYEYASKFGGGLWNFKNMMYSKQRRIIRMKFKKED